ncbi:MAG: hypothetical protein NTX50_12365 [Candidatus Sumerlaeota bacterium]|nr:hypothetical protein [Candidatus Sumerlaeota bacterium]
MMSLFLNRKALMAAGIVGTLGMLFWGAYNALLPPKKTLSPERREAMRAAAADLLKDMPRPKDKIQRLAVAPLAGDFTGEATQYLRDTLDAMGAFNVAPAPVVDRARDHLRLEKPEAAELDDAMRYAKSWNADQVLWGRINRLSQESGVAAVDIELSLNDAASRAALWKKRFQKLPPESGGAAASASGIMNSPEGRSFASAALRILGGLLFLLMLPLALSPLARRVLEEESNMKNLLLLISLAAMDILGLALILYRAAPVYLYAIIICLLSILGGWYNYWVCNMLEKHR